MNPTPKKCVVLSLAWERQDRAVSNAVCKGTCHSLEEYPVGRELTTWYVFRSHRIGVRLDWTKSRLKGKDELREVSKQRKYSIMQSCKVWQVPGPVLVQYGWSRNLKNRKGEKHSQGSIIYEELYRLYNRVWLVHNYVLNFLKSDLYFESIFLVIM